MGLLVAQHDKHRVTARDQQCRAGLAVASQSLVPKGDSVCVVVRQVNRVAGDLDVVIDLPCKVQLRGKKLSRGRGDHWEDLSEERVDLRTGETRKTF